MKKFLITYVLPIEHVVFNMVRPSKPLVLHTSCDANDFDAAIIYANRFKSLYHALYAPAQPYEHITTHIESAKSGAVISYNVIQ